MHSIIQHFSADYFINSEQNYVTYCTMHYLFQNSVHNFVQNNVQN